MSKGKNKPKTGIANLLDALAKQDAARREEDAAQKKVLEPTRGKKRSRDGSPIAENTNGTANAAEVDVERAGNVLRKDDGHLMVSKKEKKMKPAKKRKTDTAPQPKVDLNGASETASKDTPQSQSSNQQRKSKPPNGKKPGKSEPATHLTKKRDALLSVRKSLPIWPHAGSIREALRKNNVLVLTGETGSGKSTQVPQFLLSEPWCNKCIAITQPRRVAAISLARRVAEEMGSLLGNQSPAAKVGYSVRFDNASGPHTRVKFLTEGMLLQEFLRDPEMEQYSAIVVDEVHERSVNVDLILGFLRNLVAEFEKGKLKKRKTPLRVVVMSATADVDSLVRFFDEGLRLEDMKEDEKASAKDQSSNKQRKAKRIQEVTQTQTSDSRISTCFVEGRQYPVKTVYLPEPTQDWVEAALKLIFKIHYQEPLPGDILVFLTGQDTIESLEKLINDYAEGMDKEVPKVRDLTYLRCSPLTFRSS